MAAPSSTTGPAPAACFIHDRDCLTGHGNARETWKELVAGRCALKPAPALGPDGGDPVPLALRAPFRHAAPPRWWNDLVGFLDPVKGPPWGDRDHPVLVASSNFGIDALYSLGKKHNPAFIPFSTPHGCVEALCRELGWGAHHYIFSHACVSAHLAMERAARFISTGRARRALVVAFDFVGPFVSGGFHALKILNQAFPAPYRDTENGSIGLGDGAAYFVLDREGSPFRLGRSHTYNEMFHFTGNDPSGSGFDRVLAPHARSSHRNGFWIKGHGTGTLEAGKLEARAVDQTFPGAPLVSWKGSLGHTLGSCAAVETALALEAIENGEIPGTVGSGEPFFASNVRTAPFSPNDFDSVLLLSNAFGGAHASLLLHYD